MKLTRQIFKDSVLYNYAASNGLVSPEYILALTGVPVAVIPKPDK